MLEITLNCQPDPQTLTQLVQVAMQEQKSLESLLDEASRGDHLLLTSQFFLRGKSAVPYHIHDSQENS